MNKWDKMYMDIALRVAKESKCPRKQVGCCILLESGLLATVPGFYNGNNLLNSPTGTWCNSLKYIRVTKHTNNNGYVLQEAIDFNGVVSAFRIQNNGYWGDWQYYAIQKTVAEFTAVNQTKVYTATLQGPYGFNLNAKRSGNVVTATLERLYPSNLNFEGTASETIPIGWRPVTPMILGVTGESGSVRFNDSYARLKYSSDGSISGYIKRKTSCLTK